MVESSGAGRLEALLDAEMSREQPAAVVAAARHAASRHGASVLGVLFYGSCLRTGDPAHSLLDFYLLVSGYRAAHGRRLPALANRLLPPNVYYDECTHEGVRLRCKYAVISLDDFCRHCRGAGRTVSIWARFSQPVALIDARHDEVRTVVTAALGDAVRTMLAAALPLCDPGDGPAEVWTRAFTLTYGAELRAERPGKGRELYELDRARHDRLFAPALDGLGMKPGADADGRRAAERAWRRRRRLSKTASLLRLVKAAFTFTGGIDYLAWKISRHSGVVIEPAPWQRRHPLLAGLALYLRLRRKGAFR